MKVFVSSLISGMETLRAAAREAVVTLRHEPVMAEDFGAQLHSPQVACLTGLRNSELVVLILAEHYGSKQPSGLSATHEEYREAKGRKPVIAFVQEGGTSDPDQAAFIKEVQGWEGGLFRGGFTTVPELKIALTRALHDYELANAVGPLNPEELTKRALALFPRARNGHGSATVILVVSGGPRQSILRPVEIENPVLAEWLHQEALFGSNRLFDPSLGVQRSIDDGALVLSQERDRSRIRLDEEGSILIVLPVRESGHGMPELIEEHVQAQLANALGYSSAALDRIDATQRLIHVTVAASIEEADYMGWRTRRESESNPNRMTLGFAGNNPPGPVHVSRPRAALRLDAIRIVEDLLVPLRRQRR